MGLQSSPFIAPWTYTINAAQDTVGFFAGPGTALIPGQPFFINIYTALNPAAGLEFEARWTNDRQVPEPASAALVGAALLGVCASRRAGRPA